MFYIKNIFNGKTYNLILSLLKVSPYYFISSLFLKLLFLLMQAIALGIIFHWSTGHVNYYLLSMIGQDKGSYIYPGVGAFLFVTASLISLLSKIVALKAIEKLEVLIVKKSLSSKVKVSIGDLKNIVKLLIHVVDVIMPTVLFVGVTIFWMFIAPSMVLFFVFVLIWALLLMKKGVRFSSSRYGRKSARLGVNEYLSSDDHKSYYNILLMSNYLTAVVFPIISVLMVVSLVAASHYSESLGSYANKVTIVTALALFQTKGFIGLTLKIGTCYKSLILVNAIMNGISFSGEINSMHFESSDHSDCEEDFM